MKIIIGLSLILLIMLNIFGYRLFDHRLAVIETRLVSVLANQTAPEPLDLFKKELSIHKAPNQILKTKD